MTLGYYPAFTKFAGSQHLGADTFKAVVCDVLDGFAAQGALRFVLLNTGVSTETPLDEVAAGRGEAADNGARGGVTGRGFM